MDSSYGSWQDLAILGLSSHKVKDLRSTQVGPEKLLFIRRKPERGSDRSDKCFPVSLLLGTVTGFSSGSLAVSPGKASRNKEGQWNLSDPWGVSDNDCLYLPPLRR